jgi:hypothetical protein
MSLPQFGVVFFIVSALAVVILATGYHKVTYWTFGRCVHMILDHFLIVHDVLIVMGGYLFTLYQTSSPAHGFFDQQQAQ